MLSASSQVLDEIRSGHSLSLSGVARLFPGRGGRPMNPSTIFRWISDGVKLPDGNRLKLEAVRIGRRLITSGPAIERFVLATTEGHGGDIIPPRTPAQRRHATEEAERELDAYGV